MKRSDRFLSRRDFIKLAAATTVRSGARSKVTRSLPRSNMTPKRCTRVAWPVIQSCLT